MINKPSTEDLAEADRLVEMSSPFIWRSARPRAKFRDAIASALASARTAAAEDMREDDSRWIMTGDLAPTDDEIRVAGWAWCNSLDRETFLSDEHYFRNMWSSLPGLKAYVAREIAKRDALFAARRAAIRALPVGGE